MMNKHIELNTCDCVCAIAVTDFTHKINYTYTRTYMNQYGKDELLR